MSRPLWQMKPFEPIAPIRGNPQARLTTPRCARRPPYSWFGVPVLRNDWITAL